MKIKTIQQAEKLGLKTWSYSNVGWIYKDTDDYLHIMRDGEELLPNIKKLGAWSYQNGDWGYRDLDGYNHLIRDGEELLPKIKKLDIHSYKNGDWTYQDTDGYWHLMRDGEKLLPEVKKKFIISYPNGDWDYLDTNNEWQIMKSDNIIKELEKKLEIAISQNKKLKKAGSVAEYWIKYGHNFFGDSAIKYHKKGNMSSEEFIKIYEYYFENGGHSCDKEKLDAYYKELKENNKMVNGQKLIKELRNKEN